VDSTKAVEAPRKATTHIQNTAPGPPKAIAVATPAILPTPTRPDSDIDSAWKGLTPAAELRLPVSRRSISTRPRTCMKRVRIEKYSPAPRHSQISGGLHIQALTASTRLCIRVVPRRACHHAAAVRSPPRTAGAPGRE